MICWLASYPRSGCDVLRPVLKAAFGLTTYNYHEPDGIALSEGVRNAQLTSYLQQNSVGGCWDTFYRQAGASSTLTLIKTHLPPNDSHPCIHVVRDGRSCMTSFQKFISMHYPGNRMTLDQLIRGQHTAASWQKHYFAWKSRAGSRRLMLRYEEILEGSDDLLKRLASFLKLPPPAKNWTEARAEIYSACPNFGDDRMPRWKQPPSWRTRHTLQFWWHHHKAMQDLGYL